MSSEAGQARRGEQVSGAAPGGAAPGGAAPGGAAPGGTVPGGAAPGGAAPGGPVLSVSLGLWQDRPAAEVVRTAEVADALGYGEIWVGEMATFDAFALGAVVAERTARAALTIGPRRGRGRGPAGRPDGHQPGDAEVGGPAGADAARRVPRGRPVPPVAAWLAAVVDPSAAGIEQLRRGLVSYLSAPGYGEMFAEAGFGDVVRFARTRPHPGELLAAVPPEIVGHVSLAGEAQAVRARLAEYANAGVDQIALVPGSSDADPAGVATLTALAP